jgi:hypothetical protein
MNPGNKYQPYTAADILRYLQGEMTVKEMHQLERAALDDPFLEDAIDGYRLEWEKGNREKLIASANEALAIPTENEKEPARVVPFFRRGIFKYAVAAILIGGAGWFLFTLNNQNVSKEENVQPAIVRTPADTVSSGDVAILKNEEDKAAANATIPYKNQVFEADSTRLLANAEVEEDLKQTAGNVTPVESPNLKGVSTTNKDIAAAGKPVGPITLPKKITYTTDTGTVVGIESRSMDDFAFAKTEKVRAAPQSAPNANFAPTYMEQKKQLNQRYTISGKTMDKEKYPLENITLRVKGDTIATVSDELGRFQMNLPDSQAVLVASGVGIETKEFLAKAKRGKVEVELEASKAQMLEEVVVSGYAAKRSRTTSQQLDMDTADASPNGGWTNFTRYIEKNKQVKAGKQPVYVVLSFEVDENGKPASMDIIESGGKAYDKEAMRLLKEGPLWINKTKDKVTFAKITIVL